MTIDGSLDPRPAQLLFTCAPCGELPHSSITTKTAPLRPVARFRHPLVSTIVQHIAQVLTRDFRFPRKCRAAA